MQLGGGKYRHRGIAVTGASSSPCRAKEIQSAFKTATRDRSGLAVGRVECCGCGGPRPRAATSRAARMVKALRRTGRASSARMGPSGTGRAPCQLNRNQWRARREPRPERSNPRPDSPATKPHPPPRLLAIARVAPLASWCVARLECCGQTHLWRSRALQRPERKGAPGLPSSRGAMHSLCRCARARPGEQKQGLKMGRVGGT